MSRKASQELAMMQQNEMSVETHAAQFVAVLPELLQAKWAHL